MPTKLDSKNRVNIIENKINSILSNPIIKTLTSEQIYEVINISILNTSYYDRLPKADKAFLLGYIKSGIENTRE